MMKRPVIFPGPDADLITELRNRSHSAAEVWKACGQAMLDMNEPCMEMSESADDIVRRLKRAKSILDIR